MKYTKTVEVEIEITEELIASLNERYNGDDADKIDYHDLDELEYLLDDIVFVPTHYFYDDITGNEKQFFELIRTKETSGIVGIKYPD